MCPATHRCFNLNGRDIPFDGDTEFLVQTGPNKPKALYRTVRRFAGKPAEAVDFYQRLQVAPGRRKRLLMPNSSYPTLLEHKGAPKPCTSSSSVSS